MTKPKMNKLVDDLVGLSHKLHVITSKDDFRKILIDGMSRSDYSIEIERPLKMALAALSDEIISRLNFALYNARSLSRRTKSDDKNRTEQKRKETCHNDHTDHPPHNREA